MRSIPAIVFSAAFLAALACGAPAQSSNQPPDPMIQSQEEVIATAIAVALTDTAPPTATPPRATASPPGPTSRGTRPPAPTVGATAAPIPPGPTNTASPAMVLTTRVKPTATIQPTPTLKPTPVPIYTDPNFDLNQFAPDPTLGIWWERTAEDLGHTDPWITPPATVNIHPYFGNHPGNHNPIDDNNYIISPVLAAYAIDFMETQDYEFPIESKSDKDRIKYQIAASLRFEILSPDLPIVRFQAMFLGDKKATFRNPNSSDSYFRKAFLMGGVLVLDWAPLTQEEAQRIRQYLKPREVIGSLIFEPAEKYHNRRGR